MILFFIGDRYLFVQSREGVRKEEEEAGWNDDVRMSSCTPSLMLLLQVMSFNLRVYIKLIRRRRSWDRIQCFLNKVHCFESVGNQKIKVVARRSLHYHIIPNEKQETN